MQVKIKAEREQELQEQEHFEVYSKNLEKLEKLEVEANGSKVVRRPWKCPICKFLTTSPRTPMTCPIVLIEEEL